MLPPFVAVCAGSQNSNLKNWTQLTDTTSTTQVTQTVSALTAFNEICILFNTGTHSFSSVYPMSFFRTSGAFAYSHYTATTDYGQVIYQDDTHIKMKIIGSGRVYAFAR